MAKKKDTTSFSFHLDNEKESAMIEYLRQAGVTNTVKRALMTQIRIDAAILNDIKESMELAELMRQEEMEAEKLKKMNEIEEIEDTKEGEGDETRAV